MFWQPSRIGVASAWYGHIPFAFWLMSEMRPISFVELGTHNGVSYAAFCDAVLRLGLPTRCFAVDTWRGDQHAGYYGEEVFGDLSRDHDLRYRSFSRLLRMTFDEALLQFSDDSIDLLHIDGEHTYEAVRHDFDTWRPKLSDRAVVLFHDTNVRENGFGVWRLWNELRDRYPGFEFLHASGLGVLAVGEAMPGSIAALCDVVDPETTGRIRDRFARLGERWEAEARSLSLEAAGSIGRQAIPDPGAAGDEERVRDTPPPAAARTKPSREAIPDSTLSSPGKETAKPSIPMRISAIIPLCNGAQFIESTLDSILGQTLPPAEIIVVDDGSTDHGPDIVARMAALYPITLLRKANGGQSSARNLGVASSTGTHIAFLDQDDLWYPNHLEKLAAPFLEHTVADDIEMGWSYGNLDEADDNGRLLVQSCLRMFPAQHPKRDVFECIRNDMFVLPSASLISRRAFDAVGGFDETLSGYEDDDLFLRIMLAGYNNHFVEEAVTRWRIHGGGCSYSPRMDRSRILYLRKLLLQFPDDKERRRFYKRHYLVPRFFPSAVSAYGRAVRAREAAEIAAAAANLAFVARLRGWWAWIPITVMLPALRSRRLAPILLPALIGIRPAVRRFA